MSKINSSIFLLFIKLVISLYEVPIVYVSGIIFSDVIKGRIDKADDKAILSTTSRYLSGATDREGGKAERDAKKLQNTS